MHATITIIRIRGLFSRVSPNYDHRATKFNENKNKPKLEANMISLFGSTKDPIIFSLAANLIRGTIAKGSTTV